MNRRRIGCGIWLVLAACLYFFENNTGTRILLCCSLLFLLFPRLRRLFFAPDRAEVRRLRPVTVKTFSYPEEEEAGDVRAYEPGDPVNRIHWKLSAKRNELLVRKTGRERVPDELPGQVSVPAAGSYPGKKKKRELLLCLAALLLSLLCLAAIPALRYSAEALCNRLFAASEQVNAYVYERFPVPAEQSVWPAVLCLALSLSLILGILCLSGSRSLAFCLMAGCMGFQMYFGLAFPPWANVALFSVFAVWMAGRPCTRRSLAVILAGILAVSLLVPAVYPGVDPATETASEQVRDALSRLVLPAGGTVREDPEGENETRHTHTQSLIPGDLEAGTEKEYRLETAEEEQISVPLWINYLKMLLLLLAAVALVTVPFLPFLVLNARRKKTLEARKAFASGNVSEAVCAVFQQVIVWLEATGHGAGNLPYREWAKRLSDPFSPEYARRFGRCAALFEEAAYSHHPLEEEHRRQVLSLLEETGQILIAKADWKQKIRLRVGGVWIT